MKRVDATVGLALRLVGLPKLPAPPCHKLADARRRMSTERLAGTTMGQTQAQRTFQSVPGLLDGHEQSGPCSRRRSCPRGGIHIHPHTAPNPSRRALLTEAAEILEGPPGAPQVTQVHAPRRMSTSGASALLPLKRLAGLRRPDVAEQAATTITSRVGGNFPPTLCALRVAAVH